MNNTIDEEINKLIGKTDKTYNKDNNNKDTLILSGGGTAGILYAGGINTLSTAVGAIDIMSVFFDGTNYYASLVKGYV